MPPKKRKTDKDSGLPSEYAAMPSKHDVINTYTEKNDPFSFPDVMMMTMDKPTLKSELNSLKVFIVGNPLKANLQEKNLQLIPVNCWTKVLTSTAIVETVIMVYCIKQEEVSCFFQMHFLPGNCSRSW